MITNIKTKTSYFLKKKAIFEAIRHFIKTDDTEVHLKGEAELDKTKLSILIRRSVIETYLGFELTNEKLFIEAQRQNGKLYHKNDILYLFELCKEK